SELMLERLDRCLHVREVEPARCGAPLHLARVERAGQVLGYLGEDARLAAGLGLLYLIPVAQDLGRRLGLRLAEDMRVTADQLLSAVSRHRPQIARSALLEQQ